MKAVQQRLHAYPVQALIPWWLAGPAAAALATGLALVTGMNSTSAGTLYVLAVVLAVSIGQLRGALAASAVAFIGLNYFFTSPRYTFQVAKTEDLVALMVFLVVAVVVSSLFSSVSTLAIERRTLDEQAHRARLDSEASDLRAAMFSAVTHDLKSPITSIKASIDSLLHPDFKMSDEDVRSLLEGIGLETDRLNRLVNNVLDLARMKAGAMDPRLVDADMLDLLGVVLARMGPTLNGHKVNVKADPELPGVCVDVIQMDHVLTNLVENAVRFSPPTSPIEVRIADRGEGVEVSVADHGPGIPTEEWQKVLDPFYRMERDRGRAGSGLGLAIVSAMVSAQGGSLRLKETRGGGATVIAELPASRPR